MIGCPLEISSGAGDWTLTTLVALASKDAIVMGTDSLGTVPRDLVDPFDLLDYFDSKFKLKMNEDGSPLLEEWGDILRKSQSVPYNLLSNVPKLFSLSPLPMGVMFTGITSIGDRTIGNLVAEFRENLPDAFGKRAAVEEVAQQMLEFLRAHYTATFTDYHQPSLELMVCGYSTVKHEDNHLPKIHRLYVHRDERVLVFDKEEDETSFGVAFGGQMDWVQRLVHGIDPDNEAMLEERATDLLDRYRAQVQFAAFEKGLDFEVPPPTDMPGLFDEVNLNRLDAAWGDFSVQNAIDCVDFFLGVMAKAQAVSSQLPTVGPPIHIAVVRKEDGFRFVSRQEWTHEGQSIPVQGGIQ